MVNQRGFSFSKCVGPWSVWLLVCCAAGLSPDSSLEIRSCGNMTALDYGCIGALNHDYGCEVAPFTGQWCKITSLGPPQHAPGNKMPWRELQRKLGLSFAAIHAAEADAPVPAEPPTKRAKTAEVRLSSASNVPRPQTNDENDSSGSNSDISVQLQSRLTHPMICCLKPMRSYWAHIKKARFFSSCVKNLVSLNLEDLRAGMRGNVLPK